MLQPTSATSEKIEKDKLREQRPFKVFVDDNFNYTDESERYQQGEYKTEEEAISVCKQIVDDYLLGAYQPGMTAEQLCESYMNFGEDPFIRGLSKENSFSARDYAQKRAIEILEERSQALKKNSNKDEAVNFWKYELDHKYGLLLPESEIMEDENRLYFYQTNRKKLCAAWDIKKKTWEVNLDRSLLEGLSFSTPKRFEQAVFDEKTNDEGYLRKQYLTEYLLLGIEAGEIKRLTKELNNGAKIEFSVGAETWNEMLIGNSVVIEGGMCKFFERDAKDERILHFGMLCENWDVTIEFILGDYEEYEQHTFGIKAFDGYYN